MAPHAHPPHTLPKFTSSPSPLRSPLSLMQSAQTKEVSSTLINIPDESLLAYLRGLTQLQRVKVRVGGSIGKVTQRRTAEGGLQGCSKPNYSLLLSGCNSHTGSALMFSVIWNTTRYWPPPTALSTSPRHGSCILPCKSIHICLFTCTLAVSHTGTYMLIHTSNRILTLLLTHTPIHAHTYMHTPTCTCTCTDAHVPAHTFPIPRPGRL